MTDLPPEVARELDRLLDHIGFVYCESDALLSSEHTNGVSWPSSGVRSSRR